jgi:hypothetical protein
MRNADYKGRIYHQTNLHFYALVKQQLKCRFKRALITTFSLFTSLLFFHVYWPSFCTVTAVRLSLKIYVTQQ